MDPVKIEKPAMKVWSSDYDGHYEETAEIIEKIRKLVDEIES